MNAILKQTFNVKKTSILLALILILSIFLRLWKLNSLPVSLFGDEVDVGYHAYSLLKTGKDYLGNLPIFYVHSIADKKAPLYSYIVVPTVGFFGITPIGVRLPAVIFGVLGILLIFLITRILVNESVGLIAALMLTLSPWHIQFSRGGLEHTLMLSLFLAGVYFLLRSFSRNRLLLFSSLCFALTPYAYHAAKIFLPLILFVILAIWFKEIKKISRKYLVISFSILSIVSGPIMISSFFGSSAERFDSLSIFNNPINIGEIGVDRVRDKQMNFPIGNLFHNKYTLLFGKIEDNYLKSFSTQFLFTRGDPNLRHSILQNGEFYKYQLIFLILGIVFFASKLSKIKSKFFIASWLMLAPFPSIITNEGGEHAGRLFFMIPPLIILIATGIYYGYSIFRFKKIYLLTLIITIALSFTVYIHNYFVHYPFDGEYWWHSGYKEAIQSVVLEGKKYEKVIISSANEPSLIFFLAWSSFSPEIFQKNYPLKSGNLDGIGKAGLLDKYYFTEVGSGISLYELGAKLPKDAIYLATQKEINLDLIKEPDRVPSNLQLIKSVSYPSGVPAFYLFTKK